MKQHISVEQLNELSDKAKEKLREWWKPAIGDVFYSEEHQSPRHFRKLIEIGIATIDHNQSCWFDNVEEIVPIAINYDDEYDFCYDSRAVHPLLSIGQMIEFLEDSFTKPTEIQTGYADYEILPYNYGHVSIEYFGKRNGGMKSIRIVCTDHEEGILCGYISKVDGAIYFKPELFLKYGSKKVQEYAYKDEGPFDVVEEKKKLFRKHLIWGENYELCNALWEAVKYILSQSDEGKIQS